ncbi:DUF4132 domain-containing protein [Runella sp. MFBS21]|uniref:DUF4132 domain-containing protein n=1 Tax=Runella sp. MFBS21 TaxID=3034018 RepID=UPI0023F99788|nr:DUF4132 domain-containing protein [Runella sp. MFBS21]MDF7819662.1 DUF4132 domain-containing protein [Runella sp. MFBS21]
MTLQERTEKIEAFRKVIEECTWYPEVKIVGEEFLNYITSDSSLLPSLPIKGSDSPYYLKKFLEILDEPKNWNEIDKRIIRIITQPHYWKNPIHRPYSYFFEESFYRHFIPEVLNDVEDQNFNALLGYWQEFSFDTSTLIKKIISSSFHKDLPWYNSDACLRAFGNYILKLSQENFELAYSYFEGYKSSLLFKLLLIHDFNYAESLLPKFLAVEGEYDGGKGIGLYTVQILLEKDPERYEPLIIEKIPEIESAINMWGLSQLLLQYLPQKYENKRLEHAYLHIDRIKNEMRLKAENYHDYNGWEERRCVNKAEHSVHYIIEHDAPNAQEYLCDLLIVCKNPFFKKKYLPIIVNAYKEAILSILFSKEILISPDKDPYFNFHPTFLKTIQTLNYQPYEDKVWEFTRHKSKKIRELAAVTLSKLGERIIPEAEKLLNDKKAEIRQTAALILTLLNSAQAQAVLMNAIDSEKNDDARDTMLEGVVGWLTSQATQEAVLQRVAKAKTRGKLEKPLEWWLDETQLPALYWQDSPKSIDSEVVRFLCYRMSRARDIRTDPEAKPLLALIDRQSSGDFAKKLLKLYFDNGGDAKYKFCLTLGGLLGDDDSSELLKRKVNDWADNGRGKMAEYAVKALALQGSNKALRAVEFFSRKYKNKYKNIGAAAHEAFGIAAEELGISPYDLADSIIPDFGFEGLFREFEVDGETYRAFINTDFKMVFLNEDNRLLKSPPKGISKELAEEFKEITKEIRDIVKSQSSRLEQYLVIQRKWEAEKWQAFFLQNPVMFAYAVRLIWGAYDADGHLKFTFRCEQDQTLLNAEGEETELDEDLHIGMVHPISLSPALIDYWNGSLYDADIEPIFPQLNRKVIPLPEGDKPLVISNEFKGVKYGGYGFTSKMEKLGWYRGSVVDAGWISSFYKDFAEANITAIITQQGELSVGDPSAHAELSELMFVKRNQVSFGSYVYDEPSNANDPRLVPFGELPPIVYSEVMADMQFFKDNQLKD